MSNSLKNCIDVDDKYSCCGCFACEGKCPTNAISINVDEEGFLYPTIDENKCVLCGKCVKVCAFRANRKNPYPHHDVVIVKSYAVQHKDDEVRANSRSGGIFTALSDEVLNDGGVVYGCVMETPTRAIHARATSPEQRDKMRGSKYIESDLSGIFPQVEKDLMDGKHVLFTGTSCQVAALKFFLGKEYENLLCVDIICHGVPSPLVWNDYVAWLEGKNSAKCECADFRDKGRFGWRAHFETLYLMDQDGRSKAISSDIFKTLFFGHKILRKSCFVCPYKSIEHPADITIGDFWGIENAAPEFDDNRGVSLVLVNNQKGKLARNDCEHVLRWKETDINKSMQPALEAPFSEPKDRGEFWERYKRWDFSKIAKKYGRVTFMQRLKRFVKGKLVK